MLLQTNSYIVPKDKRTEHARLVKRFRTVMARLGCEDFDVFEQSGPNWSNEVGGRFVQIMRFRDREHQLAIRAAEQSDAGAQDLVREFCELVNFAYQHQQGLATTAYYTGMGTTPPGETVKQLPGTTGDAATPSASHAPARHDAASASEPPLVNGADVDDADRDEADPDDATHAPAPQHYRSIRPSRARSTPGDA